jgi:hypothetical protein
MNFVGVASDTRKDQIRNTKITEELNLFDLNENL